MVELRTRTEKRNQATNILAQLRWLHKVPESKHGQKGDVIETSFNC